MKSCPHHLGFLDGIRALAALWVLFGHVALIVGWRVTDPRAAVDVFMILSGYLMLFHSAARGAKKDFVLFAKGFYLRRFFRIAPLYYFLLAFCYLAQPAYLQWTSAMQALHWSSVNAELLERARSSVPTAGNALAHFSFLYGFIPRFGSSSLLFDWSLTLEMQFYAVFPLLFLWLNRNSIFWPVIWLTAASLVLGPLLSPFFAFPTVLPMKLPLFLVGILIAWTRWGTISGAERVLCLGLTAVILAQKDRSLALAAGAILLCDFGADPSVAGQLETARNVVAGFLSCGVMRKLADWSYGIFLVHPLVVPIVAIYLAAHTHISQTAPALRFVTLGFPVFLLSIAVAAGLHRLIEMPGIRLGRWLERRALTSTAERVSQAPPETYPPGQVILAPK